MCWPTLYGSFIYHFKIWILYRIVLEHFYPILLIFLSTHILNLCTLCSFFSISFVSINICGRIQQQLLSRQGTPVFLLISFNLFWFYLDFTLQHGIMCVLRIVITFYVGKIVLLVSKLFFLRVVLKLQDNVSSSAGKLYQQHKLTTPF